MSEFRYTPDKATKVHDEGAIRLLSSSFQSHEDGLPEWLKNCADAYAREDAPEAKRVIFVILNDDKRGNMPSISCLDFVGMNSRAIEENFRVWADPNAANRGATSNCIQGGHGNGGKCYMVQMFANYAQLYTVRDGKGNCYGVRGGSYRFGYVPDRRSGRDFRVNDVGGALGSALKETGCSLRTIQRILDSTSLQLEGFTLVTGVGPKGVGKSLRTSYIADALQEHTQMTRTLELCQVYVIGNGRLYRSGDRLRLPDIEPLAGGEEPRIIDIPEYLLDPRSEEKVSTTGHGELPAGRLVLRTSSAPLLFN